MTQLWTYGWSEATVDVVITAIVVFAVCSVLAVPLGSWLRTRKRRNRGKKPIYLQWTITGPGRFEP